MASDPILTAERVNQIVAGYVERGELWNASLEALARSHEALRTERAALVIAAAALLRALDLVSDADRERLESLDSPLVEPAVGAMRLVIQRLEATDA